MASISPQRYHQTSSTTTTKATTTSSSNMEQAPPLDDDYDYSGNNNNNNNAYSTPPRTKKGLGAMPMQHEHLPSYMQQQQQQRQQKQIQQPRVVSPRHNYGGGGGIDPPASNDEALYYDDDEVVENEHNNNYTDDDDEQGQDHHHHDQANAEYNENDVDRNRNNSNDSPERRHEDRNDEAAVEDHHQKDVEGGGDEALLDLEQLEELHHEAERMKALGNKHMAAQEYTRAYNAYSAALQLSPVGPSSHVFLSNRSAALLSLKRYSAAATDARRAIALAPTFGKAHARLGQSLYFLKDYEGAVSAYEDAIHYEPDNPITKTYLEKARNKWNRQREKAAKHTRGEEVSVLTSESSVQQTVVNSVATDPNASAAVVQTRGFRGQSQAIANAVGRGLSSNGMAAAGAVPPKMSSARGVTTPRSDDDDAAKKGRGEEEDDNDEYNQDDPDFDEALRLQERANRYLANKNYKSAIEEYTAALFLVPDDENLSPELHLGRAHALNGSRRHESAKIDSKLALRIKPTPEAYSTLAKSLFYMKDYTGSIEAFDKCRSMLSEGESLSVFDRAYLQKAETALQEYAEEGKTPTMVSRTGSAPVPKLKPPKFVSREEAMNRTPQMPSMPKQWPQQSPRDNKIIKFGEERQVLFLSEALGIKLNRGPDGIVRVIEVSPDVAGSPIAREGTIEVGDVIREAAGVDIRRPLTNIMWGDTVALIKMAPRPIVFVVAKELTSSIMDQRKLAAQNALSPTTATHFFPSNSSTEDSVRKQVEGTTKQQTVTLSDLDHHQTEIMESLDVESNKDDDAEVSVGGAVVNDDSELVSASESENVVIQAEDQQKQKEIKRISQQSLLDGDQSEVAVVKKEEIEEVGVLPPVHQDDDERASELREVSPKDAQEIVAQSKEELLVAPPVDLREEEARIIGGEIMFARNHSSAHSGWDNLRWMSYSGIRKVRACELVYRYFEGRAGFFWSKDEFELRRLAVYETPNVILVLRTAQTLAEFLEWMELPKDTQVDEHTALRLHWFVESVVDPKTCKLRLSPLTTVTSILPDVPKESVRRRSCFELITPLETIAMTAIKVRRGAERSLTSFTDSGAFLEASGVEFTLTKCICRAHDPNPEVLNPEVASAVGVTMDLSWKHQIILGTLHSYVVIGNQSFLDMAILEALNSDKGRDNQTPHFLSSRIVDAVDESDRTALHYACISRFSSAVKSLVKVGANVDLRVQPNNMTPCHICAMNLDFKSLAAILAVNRRPNVVDAFGRTPLYVAVTEGRAVGGLRSPEALDQCITVMEKYGAEVDALMGHCHPVRKLATEWAAEELAVVLSHCPYKYPIRVARPENVGISISARYQYPIHSALVALRLKFEDIIRSGSDSQTGWHECAEADIKINKTLKVLFSCGFEPNERLEAVVGSFPEREELSSYVGFAPIQIVAATMLDALKNRDILGEELFYNTVNLLLNVAEVLVQNGARISLEAPPLLRSTERTKLRTPSESDGVSGSDEVGGDRSGLKIQSNKELMQLLGSPRMTTAQKDFKDWKAAAVLGHFIFHTDKNEAIENSLAPGGSDEKTCAVCWKPFGLLVRKHRCRISFRFVCDECSSHRVLADGVEHRVSDGQFLVAKAEEMKEVDRKLSAAVEQNVTVQQHQQEQERPKGTPGKEYSAAANAARLQRLEAEAESNRDFLLGGILSSVANSFIGSDDSSSAAGSTHADSIAGLAVQLSQTRDQLNERGDKLNTLAEKSDKLASASQDFAAMAKELNRKSSQGFFGGW